MRALSTSCVQLFRYSNFTVQLDKQPGTTRLGGYNYKHVMELRIRMNQVQIRVVFACSYLKRVHSYIDPNFDPEVGLVCTPAVQQLCL